ncbi:MULTISPECIES: hypothetical protein [Halobacterium]|uniref:DUF7577 domain-containing protein n=1 Tax=Halobacterium TaxID=2239 RepID=UPI00073F91E5|nr:MULTISPECIES: hypothetical protein [Halobacterium]MCG1004127.1 zinc ribbon domain-containing protein [Halobacterium noricense]
MEWGLFVFAVLLVAALQFAVWRRLQSEDAGASDSPGLGDGTSPVDGSSSTSDDTASLLCPSCGAENDAGYRFCCECVSQLQP